MQPDKQTTGAGDGQHGITVRKTLSLILSESFLLSKKQKYLWSHTLSE